MKKVFRTQISPKIREDLFAVHEFRGKGNLKVKVLQKEHIVLLKAVTERDKDVEDMKRILELEKNFNWQYLIDEAVWQHSQGDSWVLPDLEKAMRELGRYVFIGEKYLKQIYGAQQKRGAAKKRRQEGEKIAGICSFSK